MEMWAGTETENMGKIMMMTVAYCTHSFTIIPVHSFALARLFSFSISSMLTWEQALVAREQALDLRERELAKREEAAAAKERWLMDMLSAFAQ